MSKQSIVILFMAVLSPLIALGDVVDDFVKAQLIDFLKERHPEIDIPSAGFHVYTTLDMATNTIAQQSVAQGIAELEKRLGVRAPDRLQGALAAVDHSTGYIRALVRAVRSEERS